MSDKEENDPSEFVCKTIMPKYPYHSMLTHRGYCTSGHMNLTSRKKGTRLKHCPSD